MKHQHSFKVEEEASDAFLGINAVKDKKSDIIIVSLNLSHIETLDVMGEIKRSSAISKIILVSSDPDITFIQRALNCGMKGFLTSDCSLRELINAVKLVHNSRLYIAKEIRRWINMNQDETLSQNQTLGRLTPREIQIVRLVAAGMTSNEIAFQLDISCKTVEVHRYNVLRKLRLKNVSSLVNFITSKGI